MTEIFEFNINNAYYNLLFNEQNEELPKVTNSSVTVVRLTRDDSKFQKMPILAKEIRKKFDRAFFFYWQINRIYSEVEIKQAKLFLMNGLHRFEPPAELCGTKFDESNTCPICGVNRKQIGNLKLKLKSIPKKDIALSIAGEMIVSKKFVDVCRKYEIKGVSFQPIDFNKPSDDFYQLIIHKEYNIHTKTIGGINPFDFSTSQEGEIYKCPYGHTIGLNRLSELFVVDNFLEDEFDLFLTTEKFGVNRGLLKPEPIILFSKKFFNIINLERLTGFTFEVVHVE